MESLRRAGYAGGKRQRPDSTPGEERPRRIPGRPGPRLLTLCPEHPVPRREEDRRERTARLGRSGACGDPEGGQGASPRPPPSCAAWACVLGRPCAPGRTSLPAPGSRVAQPHAVTHSPPSSFPRSRAPCPTRAPLSLADGVAAGSGSAEPCSRPQGDSCFRSPLRDPVVSFLPCQGPAWGRGEQSQRPLHGAKVPHTFF